MDGQQRVTNDLVDDVNVMLMIDTAQSKPLIRYVHRACQRSYISTPGSHLSQSKTEVTDKVKPSTTSQWDKPYVPCAPLLPSSIV